MIRLNVLITLVISSFLFFSCKKEESKIDLKTDYFPLNKGHFVSYKVQEINLDKAAKIADTFNYFIKTEIGEEYTDDSGLKAFKFNRYYRSSVTKPWVIKDVWTVQLKQNKLELVEENNRLIKLVFAPDLEDKWNANIYTTLDAQNCSYSYIDVPQTINGIALNSTLKVNQQYLLTLIDFKNKHEVYARNVGLVYKHVKDFKISKSDSTNILSGNELRMEMLEYGIE